MTLTPTACKGYTSDALILLSIVSWCPELYPIVHPLSGRVVFCGPRFSTFPKTFLENWPSSPHTNISRNTFLYFGMR